MSDPLLAYNEQTQRYINPQSTFGEHDVKMDMLEVQIENLTYFEELSGN